MVLGSEMSVPGKRTSAMNGSLLTPYRRLLNHQYKLDLEQVSVQNCPTPEKLFFSYNHLDTLSIKALSSPSISEVKLMSYAKLLKNLSLIV